MTLVQLMDVGVYGGKDLWRRHLALDCNDRVTHDESRNCETDEIEEKN